MFIDRAKTQRYLANSEANVYLKFLTMNLKVLIIKLDKIWYRHGEMKLKCMNIVLINSFAQVTVLFVHDSSFEQ